MYVASTAATAAPAPFGRVATPLAWWFMMNICRSPRVTETSSHSDGFSAGPILLEQLSHPCPWQGIYPYNTSLHVPRTGQYAHRASGCIPRPVLRAVACTDG